MLIEQFDMILALNPGGNTFYFGPVDDHSSTAMKYFADGVSPAPRQRTSQSSYWRLLQRSGRGTGNVSTGTRNGGTLNNLAKSVSVIIGIFDGFTSSSTTSTALPNFWVTSIS
jgi:hypothetical protein